MSDEPTQLSWNYTHVMKGTGTKAYCERCGCMVTDPEAKKKCKPTKLMGL